MKVCDKYYDEIFDFEGQWEMPSKCGLKIVSYQNQTVVLVTELYHDNPGTSVTYAAGSLIKQICKAKNIDPRQLIYIECNPNTNSKLSFYGEEMFRVFFEVDANGDFINLRYQTLSEDEIKTYFPA
ncbi:MAG: hypothetical protein PHQ33_00725 [Bacteroidales bacterium]|jgi:hypothetical protein|nr:hypothetical protein [Bacteroidales bacterium]MDD4394405.1 hypothetical protein [Bacteroidales bacterium]